MAFSAPVSNMAQTIAGGLSACTSRNLTDTNYVTATFGTPPTAFGGRPGASRQFAIEFTVRR